MRALRMVALAGAAAVALAGVLAGTAAADPSSTPPDNSIVGLASATLTPLGNKWSTDYNATNPTNSLYIWGASGPSPITTKVGCAPIPRPSDSAADIAALNQNATIGFGGQTYYCIDLALVDQPFNPSADSADVFVTFGHDSITWAANSGGNSVATLTPAQLTSIYSANTGSCVKWSDVGGTSTNVIVPVLPQSGSGARSQFLKDLGVTTPGTCVINPSGSQAIAPNEGANCAFWTGACPPNTTANPDVIFPFSVGSYICQADLAPNCTNNTGNMVLKQINGISPTAGTGTSTKINSSFPSTFIRGLYAVARYTGTPTGSVPVYLRPLLGDGDNTGWICGTTAQADVSAQGFLPASSTTCGTLTHV